MINKKYINYIKKELKKKKEICIMYIPTEEEKEYLIKFNIKTEIISKKFQSILTDYYYDTEMCKYYIEK